MATCKSCNAPIVWALTQAGKHMPVDPEPHPDGNVVLLSGNVSPECLVLEADKAAERRARGAKLYRSHFVSCPNAQGHRRA